MDETYLKKLLDKYDYRSFVYAEYPHKSHWKETFSDDDFKDSLLTFKEEKKDSPLMFYVHIPFCNVQCFYCTCHTCITSKYEEIKEYLNYLYKEIDLIKDFLNKNEIKLNVKEIHIGGGSPTLLNESDFDTLINKIQSIIDLDNLREFSIEIDPRNISEEKLVYYRKKGINRISFGIQEFDKSVQKAINRIQPVEVVEKLLTQNIRNLFPHGINFDILVGLPNQTIDSITKTFDTIVKLSPDRICYSYLGFFPKYSKHQLVMVDGKNGRPTTLPNNIEKRLMFLKGAQILENNNYVRVGFEHFAKKTDQVVKALKEGKLKWNALGITTGDYTDVLAIGASGSNTLGKYYSQNNYLKEGYYEKLNENKFPIFKGYILNKDDEIRRDVAQYIRNYNKLDYKFIEDKHNIKFNEYFKSEIEKFNEFEKDKILTITDCGFEITEIGREFVLFVCGIFDKYYTNNN
ncbi:oxygen-independent coproporphyrinogen III oxidase [Candidatus Pacearchaeota archaeon]|nr:oxygen-independent coproporphyrinogen III oxidase [Candidatus Pacearchaeota archaeon]